VYNIKNFLKLYIYIFIYEQTLLFTSMDNKGIVDCNLEEFSRLSRQSLKSF